MGTIRTLNSQSKRPAARSAVTCLFAGALILMSALAAAQDGSPAKPREDRGLFGNIGRWFDEQAENMNSSFKRARDGLGNFGRDVGAVTKTTVDGAKDAADAVARIPKARVFSVHEQCKDAPNGAPDCLAPANAACKGKGFQSGSSVGMTTAEICPAKVYLSGRSSGPECHTETFVSRILCQ
jgi:hypothetical protein